MPKSVQVYLESARSALIDADSLPGALQHNASRYLLLLTAWELVQIADEKFSAWALRDNVSQRLLKDHGYKLRKSPSMIYIKIVAGRPIETKYTSEDEKKKLRTLLVYGRENTSRREFFMRGWHFHTFRRRLIAKIESLEILVKELEGER